MMKIVLLILLTSCTLLNAEYKRHKYRGPPHPHRVPPSQQFQKKWHQQSPHPPRNPVRSRPIPVHMPPGHKIPIGVPPPPPPRAVAPPVRNFWKNNQNPAKYQPEKPYIYQSEKPYVHQPEKPYIPRQEKPFLAAPSINTQEFDYHIQTNSIPTTHTNPIKQIGEKGPIHTIPAPNLSLKDKPAVIDELRYEQVNPYHQIEQNHQYQVTEQPESPPKQKLYRAQQQLLIQQQLQQQQLIQQQLQLQQEQLLQKELQKEVEVQPQQLYYTTDPAALSQAIPLPAQKTNQGEIYLSSRLNPKELYQIIGAAYPQLQTQVQSQEAQQVPNYQALLTQQLFQPDQSFAQQAPPVEAPQVVSSDSDKARFQPEFHSFNYDEQAHQKSQQGLNAQDLSSLVSAGYNLDSNSGDTKIISDRNSMDPLAQAQLIQSYFDTRSDVEENDVEPDAKPSQVNGEETVKKELLGSSYFSSLPNKEAAERLADLQAAGKINSSLMKISSGQQSKDQMAIYVPEEDNKEDSSESSKEQPVEYDDYSQEDSNSGEHDEDFGQRLQSKN